MGETTGIEWTDATWNPWQGCHKVSSGCKNCYMFREKTRYGQEPNVVVRSSQRTLNAPFRMKEPQKVFTCSWSDFFIEEADPWRDEAWSIIERTPHVTYQIVTKRPERIARRLPWSGTPWPNVWLGVSAERQQELDERVPHLLETPAAVRFVSAEPLLGPLDFRLTMCKPEGLAPGVWLDSLRGHVIGPDDMLDARVDWVIVGGESGPGARPCDASWVRSIVRQCREAGVACFVKQLGANVESRNDAGFEGDDPESWPMDTRHVELTSTNWQGEPVRIHLRDPKGGDPAEWPEDLRVREFPEVRP